MGELERIGEIAGRGVAADAVEVESVLEAKFWSWLSRTNDGLKDARSQFEIGPYRADATVDCDGQLVVVELDGTRFHLDHEYDTARDRYMAYLVSAVIRIPYKSLWYFPQATFGVLAQWFPRFEIPLDQTVVNCRTTQLDLHALAERFDRREVFDVSPDRGWVGYAADFIRPNRPWDVTIKRGTTDADTLKRFHGK